MTTDNKKDTSIGDVCVCTAFCIVVIAILTGIIILLTSITIIDSTEVAIQYKTISAELKPEILTEGIKFTPFSQIIRWPITYQTIKFTKNNNVVCNSQDGLKIELDVSFQYIPDTSEIYDLTLNYENFETYKEVVEAVSRSGIRHVCSSFTADEFQTKRSNVHDVMERDVKKLIEEIYSTIVELQLRNINRPKKYEDSVEVTESERSEINLALNEREQKLVDANTRLIEMRQHANKTLDLANTESQITLTTAEIEANTITDWYNSKMLTYSTIKNVHGLNTEDLLSYLGNQLFGSRGKMMVKEPSQLIY